MIHLSKILLLSAMLCIGFSHLFGDSVSLEELLRSTGASLSWDSILQRGQLHRDGINVVFRPGDPWMVLNGEKLLVTGTVIEEDGRLIFSREATDTLFDVFGVESEAANYSLTTILIDPGHGGRDSGALRNWPVDGVEKSLIEKDVVLEVSLRLAEALRETYPEKNILLTRENDVYPTLEERVAKANGVQLGTREGMIYLSIHVNASLNTASEGFEVWYLPRDYRREVVDLNHTEGGFAGIAPIVNALWEEEFTHESVRLADMILKGFREQLGQDVPDRGRREESWFVVRNVKMASVLLEIGFLSNKYEAMRLRQPEYLKRITKGIYNGVQQFIDYFEHREG